MGCGAVHSGVLATMSQPDSQIEIGDVWWLPEAVNGYPGGKGRYCLVVAIEYTAGSPLPARIHYVAGSTKGGGGPTITLQRRESNLPDMTHFSFWWSGDIAVGTAMLNGRRVGRLDAARLGEIGAAIRGSRRAALKKLVGC
jgi:hypothetical protein